MKRKSLFYKKDIYSFIDFDLTFYYKSFALEKFHKSLTLLKDY